MLLIDKLDVCDTVNQLYKINVKKSYDDIFISIYKSFMNAYDNVISSFLNDTADTLRNPSKINYLMIPEGIYCKRAGIDFDKDVTTAVIFKNLRIFLYKDNDEFGSAFISADYMTYTNDINKMISVFINKDYLTNEDKEIANKYKKNFLLILALRYMDACLIDMANFTFTKPGIIYVEDSYLAPYIKYLYMRTFMMMIMQVSEINTKDIFNAFIRLNDVNQYNKSLGLSYIALEYDQLLVDTMMVTTDDKRKEAFEKIHKTLTKFATETVNDPYGYCEPDDELLDVCEKIYWNT